MCRCRISINAAGPQSRRAKLVARWRSTSTLLIAWALLLVGGCSKPPYDLAEVNGTVTLDGRPLTRAKVMFEPMGSSTSAGINAGKPAFGKLASDGTFALSTYSDEDGAVVGPHMVTIIALPEGEGPAPPPTSTVPKFTRIMAPRSYTVEAGKVNQIQINLTKQDVAKFSPK
jgi:hypothetical protein